MNGSVPKQKRKRAETETTTFRPLPLRATRPPRSGERVYGGRDGTSCGHGELRALRRELRTELDETDGRNTTDETEEKDETEETEGADDVEGPDGTDETEEKEGADGTGVGPAPSLLVRRLARLLAEVLLQEPLLARLREVYCIAL